MRIVDGNLRIGLEEGGEVELKRGQLTLLAGRMDEGKTALALSLAAAANSWGKCPVAYFSLGMGRNDIVENRWLATIDPYLDSQSAADIIWDDEHALEGIDIPFRYFRNIFAPNPEALCDQLREFLRAPDAGEKPRLIVVDALQKIGDGGYDVGHVFVEDAMRRLKALAREQDAAVLLLSDCRGRYDQPGRAPLLSDISEIVAKGADIVWILDRDDIWASDERRHRPPADIKSRPARVHVLKRDDGGPDGSFPLEWNERSSSFTFDPPNVHNPDFAPLRHWNGLRSWRQQLEKRRLQRAARKARKAQDAAKTYSTPQELWDELGV